MASHVSRRAALALRQPAVPSEPTEVQVEDYSSTVKAQTTFSYNSNGNPTGQSLYTTSTTTHIDRSITPNSYGVITAMTDYNSVMNVPPRQAAAPQ